MDQNQFNSTALGQLRPIHLQGCSDWAFIPDPLPKQWTIAPDTWPLLLQAREALARLDGMGHYMPNYNLLLLLKVI